MTFPNAFEGVKKLFTSEILHLIGSFCSLLALILGVVAVGSMTTDSAAGLVVGGVGGVVFGLGSAVLLIIAYILKLIGLKRAGKDEPRFDQAFLLAIFALILNVVSSVLSSFNVGNGTVDNIVQIFGNIAEIIITILVINGIQTLAVRCGNEEMDGLGSRLLILISVFFGLSVIANVIVIIFGSSATATAIAGILGIVAMVLNIIGYIIFLVYLGKAKKMLANS